jgi:Rap/ran-GAP
VITVESLPRASWNEVTIRGPTGVTSFLCQSLNMGNSIDSSDSDAIDHLFPKGNRSVSSSNIFSASPIASPPHSSLSSPSSSAPQIISPSSVLTSSTARPILSRRQRSDTVSGPLSDLSSNPPTPDQLAIDLPTTEDEEVALINEVERWNLEKKDMPSSNPAQSLVLDPAFFFLQVFTPEIFTEPPFLLSDTETAELIRYLENMLVVDTFRVAVLYVGPGQTSENEILMNVSAPKRFHDFLSGMGKLVRLKDLPISIYTDLDRQTDTDGKWTYV